MSVRLDAFAGVAPRVEPTRLGEQQASSALNARIDNGAIRCFYETKAAASAFPYASGVTTFTPSDMLRVNVNNNKTWALWNQTSPVYVLSQTALVNSKYIPPQMFLPPYTPGGWAPTYSWGSLAAPYPGTFTYSVTGKDARIEFYRKQYIGGTADPTGNFFVTFPILTIGDNDPNKLMIYRVSVVSKDFGVSGGTGEELVLLNPANDAVVTTVTPSSDGTLPILSAGPEYLLNIAGAPPRLRVRMKVWVYDQLVPSSGRNFIGTATVVLGIRQIESTDPDPNNPTSYTDFTVTVKMTEAFEWTGSFGG